MMTLITKNLRSLLSRYKGLTGHQFQIKKSLDYNQEIIRNSEFGKGLQNELHPTVKILLDGLYSGRRSSLAESITLVEATSIKKKVLAKQLLSSILYTRDRNEDKNKESYRIGLTGPPGAGKSTFIETFGKFLTKNNFKVAVLAVDPSSVTSGGSILGDKTRMPELSKDMNAYIRPSPSRGHLGGVTRSTNEAIILCEAAGYDIIIIETIGVGQSEYAVADMVDIFLLLIPPGSGDELQGIKKGIMELSDIIIVNKSDGDFIPAARRVQYEYISALKYIKRKNKYWKPLVKCVSSVYSEGIEELWKTMTKYHTVMKSSGSLEEKRKQQRKAWMWTHLHDNMMNVFFQDSSVKHKVKECERQVVKGTLAPGDAADVILQHIIQTYTK